MTAQLAPHVDLQALLPSDAKRRHLEPGETLLAPGVPPKHVWFVVEGSVRSLASLPPQNRWRTVQRHDRGEFIGWLGWLHGRSIEHLRAAEPSEVIELELSEFESLWTHSEHLRRWCHDQSPTIEWLHILLQLSHANPTRSHQLDQWRQVQRKVQWSVDDDPTPIPGGHWHWIDGVAWPDPRPDDPSLQRLIWLPDPEDAALQLGLDELGSSSKRQSIEQQLSLPRASGPRDIPLAICRSLADFHGVPFNRDNLLDEIDALLQRQTQLNLINIGQLLSSLDLSVSMVELPLRQLSRVPCPAVLTQKGRSTCWRESMPMVNYDCWILNWVPSN